MSDETRPAQLDSKHDTLIIGALMVVVLVVALAAALPWRARPAEGGAALARYVPLRDGGSQLAVRYGPTGDLELWRSTNLELLRDGRAIALDLTFSQRKALSGFYFPNQSPTEQAFLDRLGSVQVLREQTSELTAQGETKRTSSVRLRETRGEFLLSITDAGGSEVLLEPPAHMLPADLRAGTRWESTGRLGQADYRLEGEIAPDSPSAPASDARNDCVVASISFVVQSGKNVLSERRWRDVYCAGVGFVSEEEFNGAGNLTATLRVVRSDTTPTSAAPEITLPAPSAALALKTESALGVDPSNWRIERVGRVRAGANVGGSTVVPVYVDQPSPMLLAAAYEGDLTAVSAADPAGGVVWRFHPGGTVYGTPVYDAAAGRIYFGASDKRLYALDARGIFLWSFLTGDNVATRPVVVNDLVIFGSEDKGVYAVEAATGVLRWRYETGGAVVSSPVAVRAFIGGVQRTLILIGSDDGGVYALDATTGERIWLHVTGEAVEAPIVVVDAIAYVASRASTLSALDVVTGRPRWVAEMGRVLRTEPAIGPGRVYVIDEEGFLSAIDAQSGRRLWLSPQYDYVGWPVLVGDTLLAADSRGNVHMVSTGGKRLRTWSAAGASEPGEQGSYQFGPVLGAGAAWTLDEQGVVRRIGSRLDGPSSVRLAWEVSVATPPLAMNLLQATPFLNEGRVFLIDDAGRTYDVDPGTGAIRFVRDLPLESVRIDPIAANGILLAASDGKLSAVRLSDGQLAWSFDAGVATRPPAVIADTVLWVALSADHSRVVLSAHSLSDGRVRWEARFPDLSTPGGMIVQGYRAYASTPPSAYDWRTGVLQWEAAGITGTSGGPALDAAGSTLYIGRVTPEDTGELVALDTATGRIRWQASLGELTLSLFEAPLVTSRTIVVPTLTGPIVAFDSETGEEVWHYAPPNKRFGTVTLYGDRIWVAHSDGEVLALNAVTGDVTARRVNPEAGLDSYGVAQRPFVFTDRQGGDRLIVAFGTSLRGFALPTTQVQQ